MAIGDRSFKRLRCPACGDIAAVATYEWLSDPGSQRTVGILVGLDCDGECIPTRHIGGIPPETQKALNTIARLDFR